MKFIVTIAACLIASVNAACDINSLIAVAGGTSGTACKSASGYDLLSITLPTAAQYPALCASQVCNDLLAEVKATAPAPCTILTFDIYVAFINPIEAECAKLNTPAPTTATPVVTTTAPTPGVTTTAPEPSAC